MLTSIHQAARNVGFLTTWMWPRPSWGTSESFKKETDTICFLFDIYFIYFNSYLNMIQSLQLTNSEIGEDTFTIYRYLLLSNNG